MARSRDAVDTIKGYYYQFDYFIFQLISLVNEEDTVTIEGIEDVDILEEKEMVAVQCKYYAKTEYNHSVIAKPIRLMLKDYVNRTPEKRKIRYKLYGKYQSGQEKYPGMLTVEFAKKNLFTYTEKKLAHEENNVRYLKKQGAKLHSVKVDIESFYPNVYTHYLSKIKDAEPYKDNICCDTYFDFLDYYNMKINNNQTKGIVTGVYSSTISAELLMLCVDYEINNVIGDEVSYIRYVDDLTFFSDSLEEIYSKMPLVQRVLNKYRDVCKYSKENADTSCIMAYYNYKLKEKGINPKPCAITDDDGEVVADDFPPDYNYLQDYVYKIVSSFDFIESPEECTIKIADAFKCYTEKYYTGEEITYFKDYSIEKVIELSEISKKWNDKFRRADKSKEEFLNLPICKKVKNIIDESSVNKYVNRKIDEKEYNYKEYEQRRIRDNMILEDVKKANEVGSISRYSEEQIQCAQKEEGKKAINALYYESVFPLMNNILFVVYYILSLITLPLIYLNQDVLNKIVAILGYLALILIVAVIKIIDKFIRNKKFRKTHWID